LFNDYCQANAEHKKRILGNALALLREKKEDISFEEAKSKVVAAVREQALFSFTSGRNWKAERLNRKSDRNQFPRGSHGASFWIFLSMCR
jgi:hypothetical protein